MFQKVSAVEELGAAVMVLHDFQVRLLADLVTKLEGVGNERAG